MGHSSPVTPTLYHSCIPLCVDFAPWGQPHCVPLAPWLPALLLLSLNQPSLMGLTAELWAIFSFMFSASLWSGLSDHWNMVEY